MTHLDERMREKVRKAAIAARDEATKPKTAPTEIASQPAAAVAISKYDMTGSSMLSAPR